MIQQELIFDGKTIVPERDNARLSGQCMDVFNLMRDGEWRTLEDIASATNHPQASVSARLRDFRKERFGGHVVERRYLSNGLFQYRLKI